MAQQPAGIDFIFFLSVYASMMSKYEFKLELARLDSLMLLNKEAFMVNQ